MERYETAEVQPATADVQAAEARTQGIEAKGVLELRAPFTFEGQEHKDIPYDFGRITRRDIRDWAKQRPGMVTSVVLDLDGQEMIFCKAAGIPAEMLDSFDVRDYTQALGLAVGFFGS
jgi:hypothetical protein